jgi:hypothetical protein
VGSKALKLTKSLAKNILFKPNSNFDSGLTLAFDILKLDGIVLDYRN